MTRILIGYVMKPFHLTDPVSNHYTYFKGG